MAVTVVTYIVEVSSDLTQPWQTDSTYPAARLGSPSDANTVQVSRSTDANGIETIVVRDSQAMTSQSNRLIRLRVQR